MIIALLVGLLIGSFLGGVLAPAIVATEYNYQLDEISSHLSTIANDETLDEISSHLSTIANEVDNIASDLATVEIYIKRIARKK